MAAFRKIVNGEAAGELAIYDRDGVLVKMAAWLRREEDKGARADVLTVRTGKDCLLVAVNTKDEALWRYNRDHLRRWDMGDGFPWYRLRSLIGEKLDARGIALDAKAQPAPQEATERLAEE
jgi:hypothetical protein